MNKRCAWPWFVRPEIACGGFGWLQTFASCLLASTALLVFAPSPCAANVGVEDPPIYNLYGQVGLLDMPSARVAPDGNLALTFAADNTGEHYNFGFQALPWLETTFRYSRIDRYLEVFGLKGDLYDRSLSLKIRLLDEDDMQPNVVIGAQDILGTGAYSGEYLAASKRWGDFDFTLGLGWRRMAGLETFPNPFGLLFSSFKTTTHTNTIGAPLVGQLFHGPDMGLFGGVTWKTPIEGLSLIAELSGDSYTREQQVGSIDIRSRVNVGLSYEPITGVEVGGGYMYGSEWAMRITIHLNAFDPAPTTKLGPQPLEPIVRSPEQRADATENLLQSITHFYDESPLVDRSLQQTARVQNLVDQVFSGVAQGQLSVKDAEVFHDNMIFEVSGRGAKFACADVVRSIPNTNSGLKQIVVTFSNSSRTEFCDIRNSQQQKPALQQYAGLDYLPVSATEPSNDGADGAKSDPAKSSESDPEAVKKKLVQDASDQKLPVVAIKITATRIEVAFYNGTYRSSDEALGRMLRVLMADAPTSVEEFKLINMAGTLPTIAVTLSRADVERTLDLFGSASELQNVSKLTAVSENDPLFLNNDERSYPEFNYSVSPGVNKSLFDPDEPFRFGVYVALNGGVDIDRHLSISGSFDVNVYNTFDITRPPSSVLPHVRTDFAQYYKKGINGISNLQATYLTKLAPDVYALGRAGYLEDMFGGIGGEVLWEPTNARWALGAALYDVQQRNFDRLFGFQPYRVLTGHASLYYQSPYYGLNFELHVGRYLAGDYGATFEMTRRFDNGIEIGAYATLTNVPFSVFGEGSFDKGFIIHIPLDNLLPVNTQGVFAFDFSPLTRDGGQRLVGEQTLYRYLENASEGDVRANWDEVLRP